MSLTSKEKDFAQCLELTGLTDIPSSGAYFTWSNKRTVGFLAKKLDRALGNEVWLDLFPQAAVIFFPTDFSDHSAGTINFVPPSPRKTNFKFFNHLVRRKNFLQTVKDC